MSQSNATNWCPPSSLPPIDEQATLKRARDGAMFNGVVDPGRLFQIAMQMSSQFDTIPHPKLLDIAVNLIREGLSMLPQGHINQAPALDGLARTLRKRLALQGERDDLVGAITCNRQALALCSADDPDRSVALNNLANALQDDFDYYGNCDSLDEAISLHSEAVELRPAPHPLRHTSLSNLANTLLARFRLSCQRGDLEKSISLYHEVLLLIPNAHPDRAFSVMGLASALLAQFKHTGQLDKLLVGITSLREVISLPPSSSALRAMSLQKLGDMLTVLFSTNHRREDLDEAISLLTEASNLHRNSTQSLPGSLNSLAVALSERFYLLNGLEDLQKEISLYREVLTLMSAMHPEYPSVIDNLSTALVQRFSYLGNHEDLHESISLSRETLKNLRNFHFFRSKVQGHLGNALLTEFEHSGQICDLDEAISLHRETLKVLEPFHFRRPSSLHDLGRCLTTRFQELGLSEDLKEAQSHLREALTLEIALHPQRCFYLNSLSIALLIQFDETKSAGELEEAVSLLRQAIELHDSSSRASSLGNLAIALKTRYDQTRQRRDLEEAISLNREALELKPLHHIGRANTLDNLGVVLKRLFDDGGAIDSLDEAIVLHYEALRLRAEPHPRRSNSLNNAAVALKARYDCLNDLKDLEKAISLRREAARFLVSPHPRRFHTLNNLALDLYTRYSTQLGQPTDIEESIDHLQECLKLLGPGHPEISRVATHLGRVFMGLFSHTHDEHHLETAISSFRNAVGCELSPAFHRFQAAREWASKVDGLHESALEAYESAIGFLPRLAALGLDVRSRQHILLSGTDGLARNAAACAIRACKYRKAVELLEEGRGIFWSQTLQLRSPMAALHEYGPTVDLARRFEKVSHELEEGSHRESFLDFSTTPRKVMSMEEQASKYRRLNDEYLTLLDEIRKIDRFRNFLSPRRLPDLQAAASNGPIILVNVTNKGSDALILKMDEVQHVPIPELGTVEVDKLVALLQSVPNVSGRNSEVTLKGENILDQIPAFACSVDLLIRSGRVASSRKLDVDDVFRFVLLVLWEHLAKPVINSLNLQKFNNSQYLRWCPTGPFTFLPIHASGLYSTSTGESESVMDYAVSTYTPTIAALLPRSAVKSIPNNIHDAFKMMAVIQPKTLPSAMEELEVIRIHIAREHCIELGMPGSPATVRDVASHLTDASLVHFACHGHQDPENPLRSSLALEDGHLTVSEIMKHMPQEKNASLAFLCACETAMGHKKLPDEVLHLGSTLLYSGFRGVVATMWSIADIDGPRVADTFYRDIAENEGTIIDASKGSVAMHMAINSLKSRNVPFVRWVPFIYIGL